MKGLNTNDFNCNARHCFITGKHIMGKLLSSFYWVKIRYEKEIRVKCPNENVARDHAMELFINGLPGINADDLRVIHVEQSEDRK